MFWFLGIYLLMGIIVVLLLMTLSDDGDWFMIPYIFIIGVIFWPWALGAIIHHKLKYS